MKSTFHVHVDKLKDRCLQNLALQRLRTVATFAVLNFLDMPNHVYRHMMLSPSRGALQKAIYGTNDQFCTTHYRIHPMGLPAAVAAPRCLVSPLRCPPAATLGHGQAGISCTPQLRHISTSPPLPTLAPAAGCMCMASCHPSHC